MHVSATASAAAIAAALAAIAALAALATVAADRNIRLQPRLEPWLVDG